MESFKPPGEMSFQGNLTENWKKWKQKFDNFLLATEKDGKEDKYKIAILLNLIGDEGVNIFNTFKFEDDEKKESYKDIILEFEKYCEPHKNIVFERFKFFSCNQVEGQSIDSYVTSLKLLASSCEFENQTESLIRDRIVLGLRDSLLQERLLREPDVSLKKAIDFVRANETSQKQIKLIKEDLNIDLIKGKSSLQFKGCNKNQVKSKIQDNNLKTYTCKKCGTVHSQGKCPAFGKTCNKCGYKNHFSVGCQNNKSDDKVKNDYKNPKISNRPTFKNQLKNLNEVSSNETKVNVFLDTVNVDTVDNKITAWYEDIAINGASVNFKLDSGAETSVLPIREFNKIPTTGELQKTSTTLISYGNHRIKPIGKISLPCSTDKLKDIIIEFQVVDLQVKPLLSLNSCLRLKLIQRVNEIKTNVTRDDVINKYSNVFDGLGSMPGNKYHIELKQDCVPVINPPRRVPIAIQDKLKLTLENLVSQGIVSKVDEPTDWVQSLVIVQKPNGSLRLCLDPKELNSAIKREHYMLPTCDEIINKLQGKKIFSVLDCKDGYWQIELDEESSKLCTFNTPFGRFKFNRLPFGIKSAPEIFQKKCYELFGDLPGVEIYFDDIVVSGCDEKEHDENLNKLLGRASSHNVKFNKEKFQFRVQEIKYLGMIISENGVKADPSHIKAIKEMKIPSNKQEVRRLLGMINYLSKFMPNVSKVTAPLRHLIKNNVDFNWSFEHEESFNKIKFMLTTSPVLKVFNPKEEIVIQADSSKDGMGACLLQNSQPVSFVSRSLSENEKNFAQIEKELLAIVFAFEKYHYFVYGKKIIVQSDHKPLETIINKPLPKVTSRLQRMLLKLLKYDFKIVYVPGSKMYIADTLSRSYIEEEIKEDEEMLNVIHCLDQQLPMSKRRIEQFQKETQDDDVLSKVFNLCLTGWPESIKQCPPEVRKFFKFRAELVPIDNILFFEDRIVVPENMKRDMLKIIHESHQGVEKCKNKARELLFWIGMSKDIEEMVLNCSICQRLRSSNQKEPMIPHELPKRPFEKIGIDILEYCNKYYLVIVDYFTKWIEAPQIQNKTVNEIINKLKAVFSQFGVPEKIVSDNNPFNSLDFKQFAKVWDFENVFVSPRYPQSNGMAEAAVGIVKKIFMKSKEERKDYLMGLMDYRNTPISGILLSPAQMMFNRRLKTKLPVSSKVLNAKLFDNVIEKLQCRQERQKLNYDKNARPLPLIKKGEDVLIRNFNTKTWDRARVLNKNKNPRSYKIQVNDGRTFTRNRRHLVKLKHPYDNERMVTLEDHILKDSVQVTNQPVTEPNNAPSVRRSSRERRRPEYLKNYC